MLTDKTVVLGIAGSVSAYKAVDIASKLTQAGARVEVVMTESATRFIAPLTFRSVIGRPVTTDLFDPNRGGAGAVHIALAGSADVLVIAPATANIIAKLAAGIADDVLTSTVVATRAPVILAPAMHTNMFQNAATQENLARLKARGFIIVGPAYGRLASGAMGAGRLVEIDEIIAAVEQVLSKTSDLAGKSVVVTAGGTREPIDPVRFIGNYSSGKMGYAAAEAARDRGAEVKLITASTFLPDPAGVAVVHVGTAVQMQKAVTKAVAGADALIMAAAVADFQPKKTVKAKIKKEESDLTLEMARTPDILSEVKGNFIKVGFAAESEDTVVNARKKLAQKQLDIIVANNITEPGSGFGTDTNKVTIIAKDGKTEDLPLMTKREVADRILDRVAGLLGLLGKR